MTTPYAVLASNDETYTTADVELKSYLEDNTFGFLQHG